MAKYLYYLKLYGLLGILPGKMTDSMELKEVIIEIDDGIVKEKYIEGKPKLYQRRCIRYPINLLYSLIIFLLIGWPSLYAIIEAIHKLSFVYITSNFFTFLFVIQFIAGYIYYQSNNFDKMIINNRSYNRPLFIIYTVAFITCILFSIMAIILLVFNENLNIYSEIYSHTSIGGKVVIIIICFIFIFYSYSVLLANLITFSSIFVIQSLKLQTYQEKLVEYVDAVTDELTISSIMQEYSELKEQHSKLIINLNNIFSTFTIIGILACYFITLNFATGYITIFDYVNLVLFFMGEFVYLYIISRLKNHITEITDVINSPKFIVRFLEKVELRKFEGEIDEDISLDKNNIDSTIKKIYNHRDKISKDVKLDLIKDLTFRCMIKSHENSESLDLIVLNSKLNEPWEQFKLFGFTIDDATFLKQLIALIIGIMMLFNWNNVFILNK